MTAGEEQPAGRTEQQASVAPVVANGELLACLGVPEPELSEASSVPSGENATCDWSQFSVSRSFPASTADTQLLAVTVVERHRLLQGEQMLRFGAARPAPLGSLGSRTRVCGGRYSTGTQAAGPCQGDAHISPKKQRKTGRPSIHRSASAAGRRRREGLLPISRSSPGSARRPTAQRSAKSVTCCIAISTRSIYSSRSV